MDVSSGCGLGVWGVSFSFRDRGAKGQFFGARYWREREEGPFLPPGFEGGGSKW